MDKYELRWGRVFSRREEERARGEPSRERGRSLERSPRRPAFRADRVPVAGDRRAEGRPSVAAGGEGYAASAEGDVWRRGHDRGDGYGSGDRRAVGVFRSPEERGRRRDERGRRQGVERFDANQGGEAAEKEEAWETSGEEEAEEDAANLERAVEDANGEDDGEEPAAGIGSAEPEEADVAGGASQAEAEGSRSGRSESRGRDASRQEEHYAERSRQQERRDWGVHADAVGTQGERGKREEEGPRASGEGSRRWERPSVNPRALDWRQAQGGWGEDGARSPDRQLMHKGGWEGEPRAASHHWRREEGREEGPSSSERRGQRQEGRGGEARTSGEEKAAETGARPEIIGSKEGEKHGNRRQRGSGSERRARRGGERHESRRHERAGVRGRRGAREKGTVTRAGTGGRAELEGGA
ncbi:unnamed protein product [Closterium sp. NIES-64]|nr:unnamed protein product [Closterium sp. NIES-64]